jgi:phospholipid-binding lipoprotein MlaA
VDATQGVKAANIMDARASLGTTLDDVLYNSADSYAQTKTLYLQNRQRELNAAVTSSLLHGDAAQDEGYDDIYEDIYE